MKSALVVVAVVLVLLVGIAGVSALGPAPSWQLNQGAPNTCVSSSGFSLPGMELNVGAGSFSEHGTLSAPGNPNLGYTIDNNFSGPFSGVIGFYVFVNTPYALPANTPLTLSVTTYNGPNFTGGVAYVSTITWDCTTGATLSISSGVPTVPSPVCANPLPDGSVVGDALGGAQVYFAPEAGKTANGVVLNPGSYWVTGFDETGEFAQVWLTCDTQLLWVPAASIGPSANAPWNGTALPARVVQ